MFMAHKLELTLGFNEFLKTVYCLEGDERLRFQMDLFNYQPNILNVNTIIFLYY